MSYKKELEIERTNKDQFFAKSHQSPISHELRNQFTGLAYYPIDESYRFELKLKKYDKPDIIQMETSDGQIRDYYKIGYLEFEIDAQKLSIQVYQSKDNPNYHFVPFRDKTSGPETYGAGRYLDLERKGDIFILDFNRAYSPYCAYNSHYSCPIPPLENHLPIEIKAGEKNFPLDVY